MLKESLRTINPSLTFNEPQYKFIPTYDIDIAYAYKHKGFIRTLGAYLKDLFNFNFREIKTRTLVINGKERDPYDTYDYQFDLQKKYKLKPIYFILFGDYGTFDKNNPVYHQGFRYLVKGIADHAEIGIHPSFYSNNSKKSLAKELSDLKDLLKMEIINSRQHFLKLDLPETYRNLIEIDIQHDYTMGFATEPGFRAGICQPFRFFDLDNDKETSLLVHPFAIMDGTLKDYLKLEPDKAIVVVEEIIKEIKDVNGTFISLWHNESLSDQKRWKGWLKVYEFLIEKAST
jgi:hypothetical protein